MKRYFVKYIRDSVKARYPKGTSCEICGAKENLQFHHFNTLSLLVAKWQKDNNLVIETDAQALEHRDTFSTRYEKELMEEAVTLCKAHHEKLHKVYGKAPPLITAKKQANWVNKQREKHYGNIESI